MTFGSEKYAVLVINKEKKETSKMLRQKERYRYLGILKAGTVKEKKN